MKSDTELIKIDVSSLTDMKPIEVEFEHSIEFDEINKPLISPYNGEIPETDPVTPSEYNQTVVDGIVAPIIRLNNLTIDTTQIEKFRLYCNVVPMLSLTIIDTFSMSRVLDSPTSDNKMTVKIIPVGDGIYKSIELQFYITDFNVNGDRLTINAIYNVDGMYNLSFRVLGEKSTCDLAREVAKELRLGYATNIENVNDARYMYCGGKTMLELLKSEMMYAGDAEHILDYWIDYWNNLTVVDMCDAYRNDDDEIKIHIEPMPVQIFSSFDKMKMIEVDALLTNHPSINNSLRYDKYRLILDTNKNLYQGTDKTLETYSVDSQTTAQTEVNDGDVRNDIFKKYEYCGEYFGELDYLSQARLRYSFLQKINTRKIQIALPKIQFGLMRGTRVNVAQYEADETVKAVLKDKDISDNGNISGDTGEDDSFVLNRTISGQYLICDTEIRYTSRNGLRQWEYLMTLTRDESTVENYID